MSCRKPWLWLCFVFLQITKASRKRLTMGLAYSESHQLRVSQQDVRLFRVGGLEVGGPQETERMRNARPRWTQARDPSVGVFLRALPRRQSHL